MGGKKIIRNRIPLLLAFFWTLIIMGSSLYSFSKINSNKNRKMRLKLKKPNPKKEKSIKRRTNRLN